MADICAHKYPWCVTCLDAELVQLGQMKGQGCNRICALLHYINSVGLYTVDNNILLKAKMLYSVKMFLLKKYKTPFTLHSYSFDTFLSSCQNC